MRLLYSLTFFTFQHSTDTAEASTHQSAGGKRAEGDIDRIAHDQHFESRVNTCTLVHSSSFCLFYSHDLRQFVDHFFLFDQESGAGPCCQPPHERGASDTHVTGPDPGSLTHHDSEPGPSVHVNQALMTTTLPPSTPAPSFITGQSQSTTSIVVTVEDYVLLIIVISVALSVCSLCCHALCCYGLVILKRNKSKLQRHQREARIKLQDMETIINKANKVPPIILPPPAPVINDDAAPANQINGNNIIPGANIENNGDNNVSKSPKPP